MDEHFVKGKNKESRLKNEEFSFHYFFSQACRPALVKWCCLIPNHRSPCSVSQYLLWCRLKNDRSRTYGEQTIKVCWKCMSLSIFFLWLRRTKAQSLKKGYLGSRPNLLWDEGLHPRLLSQYSIHRSLFRSININSTWVSPSSATFVRSSNS